VSKQSVVKSYQVIYGDPDTPKDEWQICHNHLRMPPDYIQEIYVRQPNFQLETQARAYRDPAFRAAIEQHMYIGSRTPETKRYSMRPVPPEQDYVARMEARTDYVRFAEYHYEWTYPELINGFVHFYASEEDACKDKRSKLGFERYMRTVMERGEDDMQYYCKLYDQPYAADVTLHFAITAEEIARVYRVGPRSCMSGDAEGEQLSVQAYAVDPIAVAYIIRGDDQDNVIARTVVNRDTKKYVRIYGDRHRMRAKMEELGYAQDDYALCGTKLRVLRCSRGYVRTPYLDGGAHVTNMTEDGEFHIIPAREPIQEPTIYRNAFGTRW
jgi:hypothetical protein